MTSDEHVPGVDWVWPVLRSGPERASSRRLVCWIGVLVLPLFACSKTVRVPSSAYADPGAAVAYRIRTVDHRTFSVVEYVVSDSTIVVQRLTKSSSLPKNGVTKVPFEIALKNVESIDRITINTRRSVLVAAGVTAAIVGLLYWFASTLPY